MGKLLIIAVITVLLSATSTVQAIGASYSASFLNPSNVYVNVGGSVAVRCLIHDAGTPITTGTGSINGIEALHEGGGVYSISVSSEEVTNVLYSQVSHTVGYTSAGNTVNVHWDQVKVQGMNASTPSIPIGSVTNIDATLVYASDDSPVVDGSVTIEGVSASHQGSGVWRISPSKSTVQTVTYDSVTASGNTRGITSIDMNSKSVDVSWIPTVVVNSLTASSRYVNMGESVDLIPVLVYGDTGYTVNDGNLLLDGLTVIGSGGTVSINVGAGPYGTAFDTTQNKAYVANSADNTLSVIDTESGEVTKTISVGNTPYGIAMDTVNNMIYVANVGANTVSVIDTTSDTVTETINVGNAPFAVDIDPTNNRAYVANSNDDTVSVINTSNYTIINTITVGDIPRWVDVDSVNNKAYVVNSNDNTVSVINTASGTVTDTITVGEYPVVVDVDTENCKAYVTNYYENTVSVINTTSGTVIGAINVGNYPTGMAIDAINLKVYVANGGSNTVSVIDTTTDTVVSTLSVGTYPTGVALDAVNHKAYVANAMSNMVSVISSGWRATDTKSTVQTVIYDGLTISDNSRNITIVDMNGKSATVTWDQIKVQSITASSSSPLVDTSVNIDATLVYASDNSQVTDGTVTIEGETATHQGSGIWRITETKSSVQNCTYDTITASGNARGITSVDMNQRSVGVSWRAPYAVVSSLTASSRYVNVNESVTLTPVLVYEDADNSVSDGVFTLNGLSTSSGNEVETIDAGGFCPWRVGVDTVHHKAYVSLNSDSKVSVIDLTTNTFVRTIEVGPNPREIVVDSVNHKAFVVNDQDRTLAVINTTSDTVIDTFNVGDWTRDMAVDQNNNRLYLTNCDDSIRVVDTVNHTVIDTIATDSELYGIALDLENNKAYVTNAIENKVSIIDLASRTVDGTIGVGDWPLRITLDVSNDRAYVTNTELNTVSVLNTANNTVIATISVRTYPETMALDTSNNRLYLPNLYDESITVIDTVTNTVSEIINTGRHPYGVGIDPTISKVIIPIYSDYEIVLISCGHRVTDSKSSVQSVTYNAMTVTNNSRGVTTVDMNGKSATVTWDQVKVQSINANTTSTLVDTSVSIDATLIYASDDSPVTDGTVTIEGESATHQGSGVWRITATKNSVQNCTYDAVTASGNTRGITSIDMNDKSVEVAWRPPFAVVSSLTASSRYVNVNESVTLTPVLVYEDTGDTVSDGAFTLNGLSASSGAEVETIDAGGFYPLRVGVDTVHHKAYVGLNSDSKVSVVDLTTNTFVRTIYVGSDSKEIVVDSVNHKAFVSDDWSYDITVINTTSDAVIDTIDVNNISYDMAVDPNNNRLYITDYGTNIRVVDTVNYTVLDPIPIYSSSYGIALDLDNNKAYVTNVEDKKISIIDLASKTVVDTISVAVNPYRITLDVSNDRAYVTNTNSDTVSVLNTANNTVIATISVRTYPETMALDVQNNKLYLPNLYDESITVIDTVTNTVSEIIDTGRHPYGASIDPTTSKVIIPIYGDHEIALISCGYRVTDSKSSAQSVTYDTMTVTNNSRGVTTVDMNGTSATVTWDQIKIQGLESSDASVITEASVNISATLVYASDDSPVTDGTITIEGESATHQGSGVWRITETKNNVQNCTYDTITASGNTRGITSIDMNDRSVEVSWRAPYAVVSSLTASSRYVNVNESVALTSVLVYEDTGLSVRDGDITLNGLTASRDYWSTSFNVGSAPVWVTLDSSNDRAYVSNYMDASVSVIDTSNNTVIDTIDVGDDPIGIALDTENNRVYVACLCDCCVSIIDTTSNTVIDTIYLEVDPFLVAVDPSSNKAYVTSQDDSRIAVINTTSNTVIDYIGIEGFTIGVALDTVNQKAYIAEFEGNTVLVIDMTSDTVTDFIDVGNSPVGATIDPENNRLYVTNMDDGTVSVIDTTSNTVIATIDVGTTPFCVAIDPGYNRAYVSNMEGNTVTVFDTTSNTVTATVDVGVMPYGVVVDEDSHLVYVANMADSTVSVLSPMWCAADTKSSVQTVTYDNMTISGNSREALSVNMNSQSATVTWDQIKVLGISASSEYVNIGDSANVSATIVYTSDSSPVVDGTVNIEGISATHQGNGVWTATVSKSSTQTVTYDTVTASGNTRGITSIDMNNKQDSVTWDRVVISDIEVSDTQVSVGTTVNIDATLEYERDDAKVTDGTVTIEGVSATHQGSGVWRIQQTKTTVQNGTYNSISVTGNERSITLVNMNNQSAEVQWDQIRVTNITASASLISAGNSVTVDASLEYVSDETPVVDGTVSIEGVNATHQGSGVWRITKTKSSAQSITYDTVAATGNTRTITAVDMNNQSTTVQWDQVKVTSLTVTDSHVTIGSSTNVNASLVYASDDTPVTDGTVTIEGVEATHNGLGVWGISQTKTTVQTVTYDSVTSTNNSNSISSVDMNDKSVEASWDQVKITGLTASDEQVSINDLVTIDATLVYASDDSPVANGTVNIEGIEATHQGSGVWRISQTKDTVQTVTYDTVSSTGNIRGINSLNMNNKTVDVLWDRVKVTGLTASDTQISINDSVNVDATLVYVSDETPVIDGSVTIDGISASHQGSGVWRITQTKSTVQSATYDTVSASGNTRTIDEVDMNNQTVDVLWDQIKVTGITASDTQVSVDDSVNVDTTLVYVSDDSPVTDGTVTIEGVNATHQGSGVWRITPTKSTAQTVAYDSVAASGNARTIDEVDMNNKTTTVQWDQIKVQSISVSDSSVNIGTEVSVNATLVYASDDSPVIDGSVSIEGVSASHQGSGVWRITQTKSTAQSATYDNVTATGNTRTIDEVDMNSQSVDVLWDQIKVTEFTASDNQVSINDSVNIDATLVYTSDDSPVTDGSVVIEGINATHQGSGVWRITQTKSTAQTATYDTVTVSGNTRTIDEVDMNSQSVDVLWDQIKITGITVSDTLVPTGESVNVDATLVYVSDETSVTDGTVTIEGFSASHLGSGVWRIIQTKSTVQTVTYDTVTATGNTRTIDEVDMNNMTADVSWDQIKVQSISVSNCSVNIGTQVNVNATLVYASDETPVTDGTVTIEGIAAAHQGTGVWKISVSKITAQTVTYDNVSASGNTRTIDEVDMNSQTVDVLWDQIKVQSISAHDNQVSINDSVNIDATLVYASDDSPVIDGSVSIEGVSASHQGSGVWRITQTKNTAQTATFDTVTVSGNARTIDEVDMNGQSIDVLWDQVKVTGLTASDTQVSINDSVNVEATLVYVSDDTPVTDGTVTIEGIVATHQGSGVWKISVQKTTVQSATYDTVTVSGNARTIDEVDMNNQTTTVKWDQIKVTGISVQDDHVSTDDPVLVDATLLYVSDNSPVDDGTVTIEGVNAVYQTAGVWRIIQTKSTVQTVTYDTVTATGNTRTIDEVDMNSQTVDATWDQIKVTGITVSDTMVSLNETVTVNTTLVYASDDTPMTNGTVTIQGVNATHLGAGTWTVTESKTIAQLVTYDNITASCVTNGIDVVDMNNQTQDVVWDQVKVLSLTASDLLPETGNTVDINVTLVYASDSTPVVNGSVHLCNISATHQGEGIWTIQETRSSDETVEYNTITVSGNIREITAVNMNGKSLTVKWEDPPIPMAPMLIPPLVETSYTVTSIKAEETLLDVGDETTIKVHVSLSTGGPADCTVSLGQQSSGTDSDGNAWFTVTSDTPGSKTFDVTSVSGEFTTYEVTASPTSVTWDKVNIDVSVTKRYLNEGEAPEVSYVATYASDDSTFSGEVTLSSVSTDVGEHTITVTGINDPKGITKFTSNEVTYIIDGVEVTSSGSNKVSTEVSDEITIWFKARYTSGGAYTGSDGSLSSNNGALRWSGSNNRWELKDTSEDPTVKTYRVTSVRTSDGITALTSGERVTVEWVNGEIVPVDNTVSSGTPETNGSSNRPITPVEGTPVQTELLTPSVGVDLETSRETLEVSLGGTLLHEGVSIPSHQVSIDYRPTESHLWTGVTTLQTDADGGFTYTWNVPDWGAYEIRLTSAEDEVYSQAVARRSVSVEPREQDCLFVQSNSTLSKVEITDTGLKFQVSGETGTTGAVELIVFKDMAASLDYVSVLIDDVPVLYTSEEHEDHWVITARYSHSEHDVEVQIDTPTDLSGWYFMALFAILAVIGERTYRYYKEKKPKFFIDSGDEQTQVEVPVEQEHPEDEEEDEQDGDDLVIDNSFVEHQEQYSQGD